MIRLSQFAAPAALGTALFLGVQGCTHDRADEIPASATEISTGTETVTGVAPHDGTFYVWDQSANRMLYTGKADRGDTVKVDAKHDRIYLNDQLVTKRDDLTNDHHYKVFFDRAEMDRARAAGYSTQGYPAQQQGTTVVVPDNNRNGTTVVVPPQQQNAVPPQQGTTVVVPQNSNPNTGASGTVVVPQTDPNRTTIQRETVIKEKSAD